MISGTVLWRIWQQLSLLRAHGYAFTEVIPSLGGATEPPETEPISPVTEDGKSGLLYLDPSDLDYTAKPQSKIV